MPDFDSPLDPLAALTQAIRAERELLRAHPTDLKSIVAHRLAAGTNDWEEVERSFNLGTAPLLRKRSGFSFAPDPVATVHGWDVTACAVRWREIVAGTGTGQLCVWNQLSGEFTDPDVVIAAHSGPVSIVSFVAGNELLLTGGTDGVLHLWAAGLTPSSSPEETYDDHAAALTAAILVGSRETLAAGSEDGVIRFWRQGTNDPIWTLVGHGGGITALAVTPDGGQLVSAARDGTLRVWELSTGRAIATLRGHSAAVIACAVIDAPTDTSQQRILSASADGLLKVWAMDGHPLATLGGHQGPIRDMRVSSIPTPIAVTAADDRTVRIWDLATLREARVLRGHTAAVTLAAPYGDAPRNVLSISVDRACRITDVETGKLLRDLQFDAGGDAGVAIEPSSHVAACIAADGALTRIDLSEPAGPAGGLIAISRTGGSIAAASGSWIGGADTDGRPESRWQAADAGGPIVGLVPDGPSGRFLSVHQDGSIRSWSNGTPTDSFRLPVPPVTVASQPGGSIVIAGADANVDQWRLNEPDERPQRLMTIPQGVRVCACSPDGHVLVGANDGSLWLAHFREGYVRRLPARAGPILACDVSDDRALLTGSEDHLVCLWDERGELRHRLAGHEASVTGCRLASRPDRAVSCSRDRTIKLWDLLNGRCLETFHAQAPLVSMALSADSPNIAAVEETGRVLILFSRELEPWHVAK